MDLNSERLEGKSEPHYEQFHPPPLNKYPLKEKKTQPVCFTTHTGGLDSRDATHEPWVHISALLVVFLTVKKSESVEEDGKRKIIKTSMRSPVRSPAKASVESFFKYWPEPGLIFSFNFRHICH